MDRVVLLLALVASGYHGDHIPTESPGVEWFARAIVNSYDGNRSFSDNFDYLLTTLCPNPEQCTNNGTVNYDKSFLLNDDKSPAISSSDFSEGAKRLHGCCMPCSCDEQCTEKGNCCPDTAQNLPPPSEGSRRVIQECVFAGISSYISNAVTTKAEWDTGFSYFMVTDCFASNVSEDIAARCQRPDLGDIGPVYSPATERIYKNKLCAMCNGVDHVISWRSVVMFNKELSLIGKLQIPPTLKDLYSILQRTRKAINLFFMPPEAMDTDKHICMPSGTKNLNNPCKGIFQFDSTRFLERACAAGGITYGTPMGTFKNVFCFLCDSTTFPSTSECDRLPRTFALSFSAVLGSNHNLLAEDVPAVEEGQCTCREFYDHDKNTCRRLVCPPGEAFAPCACVQFLQNIQTMPVKMHLEINPDTHSLVAQDTLTSKLSHKAIESFKASVKGAINTRWGPLGITYSTIFRETSKSDQNSVKFHFAVSTTFLGTNDSRKLVKNIFTTLQSGISVKILGSSMTIGLGRTFQAFGESSTTALELAKAINSSDTLIESVESDDVDIGFVRGKIFNYATMISKLVYCQRVLLEEAEIAKLRVRPLDVGVSPGYLPYVFREEDGSMCLEDFKLAFLTSSGSHTSGWGYIGIVVSLLVKWIV